ncbi:MAG TPA: hypothetical protein VKF14_19025 [Candidatus Dormibacteraeota bacterium]|nr:hypothetical protein [Candidatus Dormibacteraeota bacterium]
MGEHSKLPATGKQVVRIEVRKDDSGYVLRRLSSAELVEELETVESRQEKVEQEQIRHRFDGLLQAGWTIRCNLTRYPSRSKRMRYISARVTSSSTTRMSSGEPSPLPPLIPTSQLNYHFRL